MLTSEQRKKVESIAYDAIKALTGKQLQIKLIGYTDIAILDNNVSAGIFEFEIINDYIDYTYLINVKDGKIDTLVRNLEWS